MNTCTQEMVSYKNVWTMWKVHINAGLWEKCCILWKISLMGRWLKTILFFLNFIIIIIIIIFTLQYCIGFATHQHASATGVHVFPILNPPSHHPPNTIPLGHLSAPAPSFLYPASNLEFLKWSGVLNLWTCNIGIICRKNNPASQAAVWRQGKEAI